MEHLSIREQEKQVSKIWNLYHLRGISYRENIEKVIDHLNLTPVMSLQTVLTRTGGVASDIETIEAIVGLANLRLSRIS